MLSPKIRQARRGKSNFLWIVRRRVSPSWQTRGHSGSCPARYQVGKALWTVSVCMSLCFCSFSEIDGGCVNIRSEVAQLLHRYLKCVGGEHLHPTFHALSL